MEIREEIIQKIMDALDGRMDTETKDVVRDVLTIELNRYELQERCTETLATNLMDRGMNIQDVAMILGHADLKTTQLYCYVNRNNVRTAYGKYAA